MVLCDTDQYEFGHGKIIRKEATTAIRHLREIQPPPRSTKAEPPTAEFNVAPARAEAELGRN